MNIQSEKYAKYICLIAFIMMQLSSYNTAKISCVQCGGPKQDDCNADLSDKSKKCEDNIVECFTKIGTDGKIVRGCQIPDQKDSCKNNEQQNCVLSKPEKNNQLICKTCEGSDKKCSQTDMIINELKYNQICETGVKNCFMKVDDSLVSRGCDKSDTKCPDGSKICNVCNKVNCNTGIFPENRRICHQCNNCDEVPSNNPLACLIYQENDECYTKGDNSTDMTRGCRSDTSNNICSNNEKGCVFCSENNCNNAKYLKKPQLSCYTCSGNKTNTDCFMKQTEKSAESCQKEIVYNEQEYCFTEYNKGQIERGCLLDKKLSHECADNTGCSKCNQTKCNGEQWKLTCIRCRSDLNAKCWDKANTLTGETCINQDEADSGCYQGVWDGVAIRGCLADLSLPNQEICKDASKKQCTICQDINCNTKPSSAIKASLSYVLMLFASIILWKLK